jgi:SAM-dependent methyltransferase
VTAAPLDLFEVAIASHAGPGGCRCDEWRVRYDDGRSSPLALGRWCEPPDEADRELLGRCVPPVLDVGCGPGRLVAALAADGQEALGIDVAASAVAVTRAAGATALRGSVFAPVPGAGGWNTVLLADGNIGIGGDPVQLLRRCRELLAPEGAILVELDPPGSGSVSARVRLETDSEKSHWFPWAHVAADTIAVTAAQASLRLEDCWSVRERWFACLRR